MTKRRLFKLLLSLFVVYHLIAVLLMPNHHSFVHREFGWLFLPYANTLGLNTPWQFFSPDPSSHVYFEYEVIPESIDRDIEKHRWPPEDKSRYLVDNYMRLIYHSRFTTSSKERIETFLIPWLCRHHPGAREITVTTMSEELVSLDKARILGGPITNLFEIRMWDRNSQYCENSQEDEP